jgi:hypothetical protein
MPVVSGTPSSDSVGKVAAAGPISELSVKPNACSASHNNLRADRDARDLAQADAFTRVVGDPLAGAPSRLVSF